MIYSAGIILWRWNGKLEVFLTHSTGNNPNLSFPKGELNNDENIFEAAIREFKEETSQEAPSLNREDYDLLGMTFQNKNKRVLAFGIEADIDPNECSCNLCEFPKGTGRMIPELDEYLWLPFEEALNRINPKQIPLLKKLGRLSVKNIKTRS